MKGIKYKHANGILKGNSDNVYDLHVCNYEYSDGVKAVESCWKMSLSERIRSLFTGRIYFQCWGRTHPPILLSTKAALDEGNRIIPRDKYGWPVERIQGKPIKSFFRILFLTDI